jgi:hypothetical protein
MAATIKMMTAAATASAFFFSPGLVLLIWSSAAKTDNITTVLTVAHNGNHDIWDMILSVGYRFHSPCALHPWPYARHHAYFTLDPRHPTPDTLYPI